MLAWPTPRWPGPSMRRWCGRRRCRPVDGVSGDPRRASAELGREGIEHIVAASVAAIRARTAGAAHQALI